MEIIMVLQGQSNGRETVHHSMIITIVIVYWDLRTHANNSINITSFNTSNSHMHKWYNHHFQMRKLRSIDVKRLSRTASK